MRQYPSAIFVRSAEEAAEDQQAFVAKHPSDPCVVANDLRKLEELRRRFPSSYRKP